MGTTSTIAVRRPEHDYLLALCYMRRLLPAAPAWQGHEPVVRPLSEVLGSDAPRLHVQGSGSGLERSISAVSSTAG